MPGYENSTYLRRRGQEKGHWKHVREYQAGADTEESTWWRINHMYNEGDQGHGNIEHHVLICGEHLLSFCCYVWREQVQNAIKPNESKFGVHSDIYSCKNKNKLKHLKSILSPNNKIIIYSFANTIRETNSPEVHREMSWTPKLPQPWLSTRDRDAWPKLTWLWDASYVLWADPGTGTISWCQMVNEQRISFVIHLWY